MGKAENKIKSQRLAEYMKEKGLTRSTGMCPIGYHPVPLPMDKHFIGAPCRGKRKKV